MAVLPSAAGSSKLIRGSLKHKNYREGREISYVGRNAAPVPGREGWHEGRFTAIYFLPAPVSPRPGEQSVRIMGRTE